MSDTPALDLLFWVGHHHVGKFWFLMVLAVVSAAVKATDEARKRSIDKEQLRILRERRPATTKVR